jgi:vacuolar protein sorting-associated protein 13A/C
VPTSPRLILYAEMVFETLIASVVNQVLGEYISNLQTDQLELGIWDGQVKLQNLRLKDDIFRKLKIPVDVVDGVVGEINLSIPWSDLARKPLKIGLKDVYVIAALQSSDWDPEGEEEEVQKEKQERLRKSELDSKKPEVDQTYFGPLIRTIVDNLQITIENIHIRYEDSLSSASNPFSIGITLSELSGVSTDKNWNINATPSSDADTIFKLLKLRNFGFYCSTDGTNVSGTTAAPDAQKLAMKVPLDNPDYA